VQAGYTVIDPVEDKSFDKLPPTSLETCNLSSTLYDTNVCYNKFLSYYQLPLLPYPQTIETFLLHLNQNQFKLYNTVIISIKDNYSEAHIYLPNQANLLNNHFFIQSFEYKRFLQLPLKSFSTISNIDLSFFLSPTPPSSLEVALDETPIQETQALNNNCTNRYPGSPSNSQAKPPTHKPLDLGICTHNVRGYNTDLKRQIWEDFCLTHGINIISITETKIAENNSITKIHKSSHFTYYWSCTDSSKAGTAIMVNRWLYPHVHKTLTVPGYAIALDIFFKHDFKFRIISVYLPCDDLQLRLQVQNSVIQWIQQAHSLNLQPIVLGDFNASDNNIHPGSIKYKLLQYLQYNNMYDLAKHTQSSTYTWHSSRFQSNIDYIWANHTILRYLNSFYIEDPDTSTKSDHKILISSWTFPYAFIGKQRAATKTRRRIFSYKNMNEEQWQLYTDQITTNLRTYNTPLLTNTSESLESTWHKIQTSVITAALKYIPNKKFTVRNFQHIFSVKASKLHHDLKKLGNIIKQVKAVLRGASPIPIQANITINQLNSTHQLNIPLLTTDFNLLSNWIQQANEEWKSLYHARNIENIKEIRQQINNNISKRCDKLQSNPKSMINSILNRHKDPVKFNNIKSDNDIITDPKKIKLHIQQHFDQWTGLKQTNQQIYESEWQQEYVPKLSINPDWYNSALSEFTIEEVANTLSQLPNNKACGPSGISYEMLKKAGTSFLQAITALFNRCITTCHIPKQWKEGRIFPISKKPIFDGNLTNTRPISLLEHIKKLYTKLLTNRLNLIFTKHQILSPYNYIALPGNSTAIPIHILNNIIEEARCNSKELWLISQDMSKAYDSVNFDLFQKSLSRINMPTQLINILSNLLLNRNNRVITNLGLTESYSVQNGIDQGETITPLFWRIYYDPLISKIATKYTGYSLSTSWKTNLYPPKSNKLQTSISVLAYMDDTLWIANSKTHMEQIINTATSFYSMTDIQVNPNKSVFATNSKSNSITFSNVTLRSIPVSQPFKYLGCWFSLDNKQTQQTKIIQEESFQLINIANTKKITDKQIIYIINTVIIPTLEYRIHNIILSQTICKGILAKCLTVAKHKSNLSRSIPNSTMLNPYLYNVRNIWDIQLQHHITNFLQRINDQNTLGITTRIRLQQLQNNLWSPTNILQHPSPIVYGPNRHTLNFKIIKLMRYLNISSSVNSNMSWPHTISYNSVQPLEKILSHHSQYITFKKQLKRLNLLFLEQLCSMDNTTLLDWKHISPRVLQLSRGRKPLWFTTLEDKVLAHRNYRFLLPHYQQPGPNIFAYSTYYIPKRLKPWLITFNDEEIIIGKIRKYLPDTNEVSITHWQTDMIADSNNYYPLPTVNSEPCPGCHLNSNRITSACTINIHTISAVQFFGRIFNRFLDFKANYLDLIYSLAIKRPLHIPATLPSIIIDNSSIEDIFQASNATCKLKEIACHNSTLQTLTFYTDGSVISIGTNQCTMGIGWVQVDHNQQATHQFSAQIYQWPSSYKAELFAILSAISTAPRNSTIHIYTDSQSVISKYTKLISPLFNPNKLFKFNAWPLWHTLLNLIKSYQLQVTFHKVQAHTEDVFNNLADSIAQQHRCSFSLYFNYTNTHNPYNVLQLGEHFIEHPTRVFIKKICRSQILAVWSSQNRNDEWTHLNTKIDWRATWLFFNHNHKPTSNFTNFKLNQLKSFKIKTLLNELPTYFFYHKRYPNIFHNTHCFHCGSVDSISHWRTCTNPALFNHIIFTSITVYLNSIDLNLSTAEHHELIRKIQKHPAFDLIAYQHYDFYIDITLKGLIPISLIETIQSYDISYRLASDITINLLLKINEQIYEQLWKPYCINFANWKKINQINFSSLTTHNYSMPVQKTRIHRRFTYSCPCGEPDQLHSYAGSCPLMGKARKKYEIWLTLWEKYNFSSNLILTINDI
jgi:ribonuclease HI